MSRAFRKFAIILCSVFATFTCVLAEDEVYRRSVSIPVRGAITAENENEITIQRKDTGKVENVSVHEIAKVKYEGGKAATDFAQAEILEKGGEYQKAINAYAKIAQDNPSKEFLVRAAGFGRVSTLARQALRDASKIDDAIQAIEEFRAQNARSRYHYALHETLGQLYLLKGDTSSASKAFAELSKAPWSDLKLKATIFNGRMLLAADQVDAALAKFDEVIGSASDSADDATRRSEAMLGKAECLAKQKKRAEAEVILRDLIKNVSQDESALRAPAHNLLGDVLRETNRPEEAICAYLYVEVYYSREREEHARALCYIALLFEQRGQNDRAEEMRSKLKRDYPSSPWVKVAEPAGK
jgi:tetratricopeptide (TPR) repeat protein